MNTGQAIGPVPLERQLATEVEPLLDWSEPDAAIIQI